MAKTQDEIIKAYAKARTLESECSYELSNHFDPIIQKLIKDKNREGLEKLLDVIPESMAKMGVYQALREIKRG